MDNTLGERLMNYNKIDRRINPPLPQNMLIELTNKCNHKCIFCANRKSKRTKGEINERFLFRILNEGYKEGIREVGYYGTGEPFMCKNLSKYIRMAKKIGYEYMYITTNGALPNEDKLKDVIDSGLDSIKFSINAGTKETYKMIHGFDDFEKVIENLKFLAYYKNKQKLKFKIYVSYIVTSINVNEKEILYDIVKEYVDDIVFTNVMNQGGLMYEINESLVLDDDKYKKLPSPCSLLFNSIHITYEGYMSICCVDFENNLIVADLNKKSLNNGWYSEAFKDLRKDHLENKLKGTLCYNCINNVNEKYEKIK